MERLDMDQPKTTSVPYTSYAKTRRLSTREKCLLIVAATFIVLSVILLIFLLVNLHKKTKKPEICFTKDCTMTASYFISTMDTNVDPCQDFYHFVCNGFIKDHPVPETKNKESTMWSYQSHLDNQLRDLLEITDPSKEPDIIFRMQESYHVCINISYTEKEELDNFKAFANNEFNGWPVVDDKDEIGFSLEDHLGKMRRMGIVHATDKFKITLHHDVNDTSQRFLLISGISWSQMPLLSTASNDTDDDDLKKRITNMAGIMGVTDTKIINIAFNDITAVIQAIENVSLTLHDYKEYMFQIRRVTFDKLNELTENKMNWLKLANAVFGSVHTYKNTDVVAVSNLQYLKDMTASLSKLSNRALKNYFVWEILNALADSAGPLVEDILESNKKIPAPQPRWLSCIKWIQKRFPLPLTRLFVNAHVDKKGKQMVDQMIQLIQTVYKTNIQQSDWLDDESRAAALKKAQNMKRMIAYPDEIFDDEWIEKEYSYITRVNPSHFANVLQLAENKTKNNLKYVTEYWDPNTWERTTNPLVINAFFKPNSIWLPTGILQLPFFDVNRIAAANFAMLGTVIGHEIGHAFDKLGFRFDDQGQLKQCWTEQAHAKYEQKTKCFVEQYDKYCPEELKGGENESPICINGSSTLGDNIADNVGLRAAHKAYLMWSKTNSDKAKRLPGLDEFTVEQIFFISFAYMWCENIPNENWPIVYNSEAMHASGQYRTMGSLSNFPEFARAFNCPEGPMNRGKDRCVLW